ncbi:hypothetical protein SAMN05421882_103727 [Nitrosomonas communis]|uniref:Uncharacterized protein n=1 Tax=Nitrosomonas communis TaxID=44574 RepID=A0A1H2XEY3_9PROT|nr:hypothetical protein SAMN05421882_103727 [Nitrosomonas communis]
MEHKHSALAKLELELKNDIADAVGIASRCGLIELLFLLHILHFSRLMAHLPEKKKRPQPSACLR